MELLAKLQEEMKRCMKAGEKDRLGVIRMLISDVKNIDLMPNKPTETQVVDAYAKKLRKSAEEYQKLGQTEQAAKLKTELAIVEEYLPRKASAEQTEKWVDEFLAGKNLGEKQVGQAMGQFMKLHGSEVDAANVNSILRQKLAGK